MPFAFSGFSLDFVLSIGEIFIGTIPLPQYHTLSRAITTRDLIYSHMGIFSVLAALSLYFCNVFLLSAQQTRKTTKIRWEEPVFI